MLQVAIQQRQRLFRDGLSRLLGAEADIEVVGTAIETEDLLALCRATHPTVVLVDADERDWDPARIVAALRRALPPSHPLRVVGVKAAPPSAAEATRNRREGMWTVVSRLDGMIDILTAIRDDTRKLIASVTLLRQPEARPAVRAMTERELAVLSLVGSGLTSREISDRLDISHKTVENHKQRIFGKLGVQNQAHAVSVAMRAGLINPERILGS